MSPAFPKEMDGEKDFAYTGTSKTLQTREMSGAQRGRERDNRALDV